MRVQGVEIEILGEDYDPLMRCATYKIKVLSGELKGQIVQRRQDLIDKEKGDE